MIKKKVLAVASGGGHWKELMLINAAFDNTNVFYVTTITGLPEMDSLHQYQIITDCNKDQKIRIIISLVQLIFIFIRFRPSTVISTGAAPGLLAILLGKIFRNKTIWIDSIANAATLSLSGKIATKYADVVLTQWPHLSSGEEVLFRGAVF